MLLAALFFYLLLSAYYILRPLREEVGLAGGVRNLPRLFLFTLATMALAAPAFGWLVKRYPRKIFLPVTYRFFAINLLVFFGVFSLVRPDGLVLAGRVFYVWVSVFNLFIVSLFWAFMADGFGYRRSRRLFGVIAAGGTLGAICGSSLTALLVPLVGRAPLLLVSIVLLELAVQVMGKMSRRFQHLAGATAAIESDPPPPARGSVLAGLWLTLRSPYLLGISAYLFLFSLSSTFLYFEQASIVDANFISRNAKTIMFARIDLWTNILTLTGQLLLTGRLLRWAGTGIVLLLLPLVTVVGFTGLGLSSSLTVLVIFQVGRRACNYALAKPARETLFTVVDLESRYKAKSFIDTFVYRGGDALGAGAFGLLTGAGAGLSLIAFLAIPVGLVWGVTALYLGRQQRQMAAEGNSVPAN